MDVWDGNFVINERGGFPSPKSLGKLLTGQIDRYRGSYVLRSETDKHTKVRTGASRSGPGDGGGLRRWMRCVPSSALPAETRSPGQRPFQSTQNPQTPQH